ncbi:hypothetical protein A2U01_0023194 [Trifolium medium]|uniref:Uncharacterized protein n=1 Tax=Trifolium medium TaxID=97028 RepID=A0A392NRY4_9FABA|nr:hypothetical protein [Trifolium medium]
MLMLMWLKTTWSHFSECKRNRNHLTSFKIEDSSAATSLTTWINPREGSIKCNMDYATFAAEQKTGLESVLETALVNLFRAVLFLAKDLLA